VASYANPQSLNRYSYVNNNPLRYTDPTGHVLVEDSGGAGSVCPDQQCKDDVQQRKAKSRHKSNDVITTPLSSTTPTVTSPPCSVVAISCHPTATATPMPTITPSATPTPYQTPLPLGYNLFNNPDFQRSFPSFPTDLGPGLSAAYENLLNGLPILGYPASSLSQVVNGVVSTVATYGTYAVTTVTHAAIGTSNAIGNAVNNAAWAANNAMNFGLSPTLPIFYVPSTSPFSQPTVYN
jgi:hypothetical protein